MDMKEAVHFQLKRSHERVQQCIADLARDEAHRSPAPRLSPVVWQIGHLAYYDSLYADRAGVAHAVPPIPEDYERLFQAGTGGQAEYPSIDQVWTTFDRTHGGLLRIAGSVELSTPVEGQLYKDIGGMLMFACVHRAYHIGKMATLRALLDKPVLFGPPSPAQDASRR
jgi:DinB superfamily